MQGTALALIGNFRDLYFAMTAEDKFISQLAAGNKAQFSFNPKELQKVYGSEYSPATQDTPKFSVANLLFRVNV